MKAARKLFTNLLQINHKYGAPSYQLFSFSQLDWFVFYEKNIRVPGVKLRINLIIVELNPSGLTVWMALSVV